MLPGLNELCAAIDEPPVLRQTRNQTHKSSDLGRIAIPPRVRPGSVSFVWRLTYADFDDSGNTCWAERTGLSASSIRPISALESAAQLQVPTVSAEITLHRALVALE